MHLNGLKAFFGRNIYNAGRYRAYSIMNQIHEEYLVTTMPLSILYCKSDAFIISSMNIQRSNRQTNQMYNIQKVHVPSKSLKKQKVSVTGKELAYRSILSQIGQFLHCLLCIFPRLFLCHRVRIQSVIQPFKSLISKLKTDY